MFSRTKIMKSTKDCSDEKIVAIKKSIACADAIAIGAGARARPRCSLTTLRSALLTLYRLFANSRGDIPNFLRKAL